MQIINHPEIKGESKKADRVERLPIKEKIPAIIVDHVSKTFRIPHNPRNTIKDRFISLFQKSTTENFKTLDNIDFTVNKGEFVGIIGRNGSGKSTLLKIIAGIYTPDIGTVTTKGKVVPFLELGVGFNAELTGRENVFLNGAILGMKRSFLVKKYQEIVDFAELEGFMDLQIKKYSSGMMVRLAFSIAIQTSADIFILDEVLAVGDAGFQKKSSDKIMELRANGATVLFVTHGMGDIRRLCDRAILIENHVVKQIGDPDEVADTYEAMFK